MSERHPATTDVWEWLEKGEGRDRPQEQRERIRVLLERMDAELHKLDEAWPRPANLPSDYWETAE